MDKIGKVKRLVESSLDTSFGGEIIVKEIHVVPTQMFNSVTDKWEPDSYAVFLTIKDNRSDKSDFYHSLSDDPSYKISKFIESILGFDTCVDIL